MKRERARGVNVREGGKEGGDKLKREGEGGKIGQEEGLGQGWREGQRGSKNEV